MAASALDPRDSGWEGLCESLECAWWQGFLLKGFTGLTWESSPHVYLALGQELERLEAKPNTTMINKKLTVLLAFLLLNQFLTSVPRIFVKAKIKARTMVLFSYRSRGSSAWVLTVRKNSIFFSNLTFTRQIIITLRCRKLTGLGHTPLSGKARFPTEICLHQPCVTHHSLCTVRSLVLVCCLTWVMVVGPMALGAGGKLGSCLLSFLICWQ